VIHGGKVHTEPSRRFLRFWPVQVGGSAAPATFLVLRLLESNPHFVGAQATLYRKRDAAFLLSRNIPPLPWAGSPKAGAAVASQGLHRGGESENFGVLGSTPNKHIFCICSHTCIACHYSYIRHRGTGSERTVPASNASVYTLAAAALVGETPQAP